MALKMTPEGKAYWLAKCESAERFYKAGDFSAAALRRLVVAPASPHFATVELAAHGGGPSARAPAWPSGAGVFIKSLSGEDRTAAIAFCRRLPY